MSTPRPIDKGIYRHNKTGKQYEVLGLALHTETDEALVLYRPMHDSAHQYFVRPQVMFEQLVEINGMTMPRFERVEKPRSFIV